MSTPDVVIPSILPSTEGKWKPCFRGRERAIVGWLEVFAAPRGRWASVPGSSRFISAGAVS